MTIPVWILLAFALWTIAVLLGGIGVRRWSQILTGRAQISDFHADEPQGSPAYRRAMRAHANCVENLPVYGAIVFALGAAQLTSPTLDAMAIVFMIARVGQSLVHMLFEETNTTVAIRFGFFFVQIAVMLWMGITVIAAQSA